MHSWNSMGDMGWWGWPAFGLIPMALFWILLIVGIIALVRYLSKGAGERATNGDRDSAMRVLRERYARGEIDTEEFEQRKRTLTQ